jgi:alanyl-tRNA synthetase
MVLNKKDNVYDTDLFTPIIESIKKHDPWNLTTSELPDENRFGYEGHKRSVRIIADHIRTSVFMVNDGVVPSNTDRGYVLRRLIRRAVFHCIETNLQMMPHDLIESVTEIYKGAYPEILHKEQKISDVIREEENKFLKTLSSGKNELQKMAMGLWQKSVQGHVVETAGLDVTGKNLFFFYSTYGFPFELSIEEINKIRKHLERDYGLKPLSSDEIENLKKDFDSEMKNHQELSKSGSDQKFKGGLGGNSQQIVRYHTATHLLHQALRDVLGPEVAQRGSNITDERLRFDFAYPSKLTDEQKQAVEQIVNDKIQADLPVNQVTLPKAEAEKSGANHLFSEKYGDEVSVYFIGSDLAFAYSKEFCGGPHVTHTAELGHFKITKEEAVAAGIRRIKAVLE